MTGAKPWPGRHAGRWGLRRPLTAALCLVWVPVLITAVVGFGLHSAGLTAPLWQLWLLSVLLVAAVTVTVPLSRPYLERDDLMPVHTEDHSALYFGSVARWEARLAGIRDGEEFQRLIQARVTTLVAERLRLRHGVELDAGDARVRRLLGDNLYVFCTRPVSRPLTHPELERVITGIENV